MEFESDSSTNTAEFVFRINTPNNNKVWLKEIIKVVRDSEGEITERYSTVFDITSLKNHEIELLKSCETLKGQNAAKDKFISIVSHDLRSPFTTLLGFSEILLNEKDLEEDERNEYLQYIYDSSKTQLNLINCLLDWSRLQTGRIKVEPVRLNVKNTVANAIAPLTGDAVRKKIDVRINIPAELNMNADERLFSQAIVSLVGNAIKFSTSGKEVNISAQRFKEGMVEIIVRDEGMGISEENHSKLFSIDQKFVLTGTDGEKGSGLGLTLMKEIIDKHGGHVWFYSKIDEGSEFHFTIPEAKNTVLIVQDDSSLCAQCKTIIENEFKNFETLTVSNGYDAIKVLKTTIPIIIIIDHDMPLMNGTQFLEALYKKESSRLIPVIVISANQSEQILNSYSKYSIENIIPKPVDTDYLLGMMKKILSQQ
jgi:signal transduction histidine kinase/ActR/RegA family two-component response regulator